MGDFLILYFRFSNTTVVTKAIHCELEMGTKNQVCSSHSVRRVVSSRSSFFLHTDAMEQFTACMMQVVNCGMWSSFCLFQNNLKSGFLFF